MGTRRRIGTEGNPLANRAADDKRTAPVQGGPRIPWDVHVAAWEAYVVRWPGNGQSAERIAQRGGFSAAEMDGFVPGWRERVA